MLVIRIPPSTPAKVLLLLVQESIHRYFLYKFENTVFFRVPPSIPSEVLLLLVYSARKVYTRIFFVSQDTFMKFKDTAVSPDILLKKSLKKSSKWKLFFGVSGSKTTQYNFQPDGNSSQTEYLLQLSARLF